MFYNDPYYMLLTVPALLFLIYASFRVRSSFKRYEQMLSRSNLTGYQVARLLLDKNGLSHVTIILIDGNLSDHFDPRSSTIGLSRRVYHSTSIASIGVAAHEVGHAIQYAQDYTPMVVRGAILPVATVVTQYGIFVVILGFILEFSLLFNIGIILYMVIVVFQIFTLPIEYNASAKALQTLLDHNILDSEEIECATKVLSAAALTYVAALITSILHIVRLILISRRRK